ncbi:hypothetical protein ACFV2N_35875 [Streptomyces sp. NPDC059680]|uniref:hypothetical protein n=1 Tax=Streptomyces sp. NPDC059680 TaxID=3346904 RepID=UPI0036B1C488
MPTLAPDACAVGPGTTRALLLRDDREARTELLLRLLYSKTSADVVADALAAGEGRVCPETAAVLATVDFHALTVERAARLRNLNRHLQRTCPPLWQCLDKKTLTPLVEGYADADAFWRSTGRTLFENFCLYAHGAVRGRSALLADVFQLFGLVSRFSAPELIAPPEDVCACTTGIPGEGMDLTKSAFSPWDDGGLLPPVVPGALQVESFRSAWRLVDERGRLPRSAEPGALEPGDHQIVVAAFPGHRVTAAALPL